MNQTINDILSRRSCKAYRNEMPTKEQLDTVIEAGLYAASGRNMQGAIMLCVMIAMNIAITSANLITMNDVDYLNFEKITENPAARYF